MTLLLSYVRVLCDILTFAIVIRAVLSWFPIRSFNPLVALVYQVTEPVLAPLRRIVPRVGMLDLTPLITIILLQMIANLLP